MDLGDVNGDGLADKIVWDPEAVEGRTRVYAGVGDGSFALLAEHTGGTSGVAASRFFHADIDADGHADKLFWRPSFRQGHPQLYLGRPDGFDPSPMMVNSGPSESADNRYFLADIDASGSHDLIAWDAGEGGATRAYLALLHAPALGPAPDDTTGGEPATTGDAPTTGDTPTTGNIPSSTGDEASTTDTNPPGTTDAVSSTAGASDSGGASDGNEAGCACTQSGRPEPAGAALLLFALGARRRRRPR
ncbi:FG-GAP repeat domain-containing protein [Nannocystis pusilla]|uniref:FG-GAP repeat domain-containing protein n=1 Tax=Nannocystis pusilla TaxID=889268 RepID=UPI003B79C559